MSSYIPNRDADLNLWTLNFSALITLDPPRYGLMAADATTIASFTDAFNDALGLATDPTTRTGPSVAAKDGAKAAMLDIVRGYAQQIRNNQGVSDEDKTALGLTIPDRTPTPVPPPASSPILGLVGAQPGVQTLRYADSNTPDKRARPFGVVGMQVFVRVGVGTVSDPATASFKSFVTKQPYGVAFDASDAGKTATYFGRWQNAKGQVGPFSAPTSMIIV